MTAVEWLEIEIKKFNTVITREYLLLLIKKAIEMEKQQIKDAYNQGYRDGDDDSSGKDISLYNDADLYYNEIYKKETIAQTKLSQPDVIGSVCRCKRCNCEIKNDIGDSLCVECWLAN